jgi:hypothetical protein
MTPQLLEQIASIFVMSVVVRNELGSEPVS